MDQSVFKADFQEKRFTMRRSEFSFRIFPLILPSFIFSL